MVNRGRCLEIKSCDEKRVSVPDSDAIAANDQAKQRASRCSNISDTDI
jgi:hypothetical protein